MKGALLQLGIGRRVDALSEKILIVTSDRPDDLIRASSVIQMLDHSSGRVLRQWQPGAGGLPSLEYLFGELSLSELQRGTLLDPPPSTLSDPLLLDEQNGGLVAIGGEAMVSRLESILQQWIANPPKPAAVPAETGPSAAGEGRAATAVPEEPNQPPSEAAARSEKPSESAVAISLEPILPASAGEPNITPPEEDFFSQELMKALATAQEKAEHLQKEIELEKASSVEESEEDQALPEIIESVRSRAAEDSRAAAEEPQALPKEASVSVLARLEEQLARQEQQIAELKALLSERTSAAEPKLRTAPGPSEPVIPEGEKELELTITLPEKVEITQLLELVGKQLGLNYMYDPTQVRGDVQLKIHDGKIKVKDTYALLESVMRFKGFVMTRRGNLVTPVRSSRPSRRLWGRRSRLFRGM